MAKELELAYFGDAVLRKKAVEVVEVTDEIRALVDDMVVTMEANDGMGLAAPQVHRSIRLFIVVPYHQTADEEWVKGDLLTFINPVLSDPGEEHWICDEGCLSIPGIRGEVERPVSITIEALDYHGKPFKETFEGMTARCIMHENDHINGVLFPDRMSKRDKKVVEPKLHVLKKKLAASRKRNRQ